MKNIFFVLLVGLVTGCLKEDAPTLRFVLPPADGAEAEKAHTEFLKLPIVKEFQADGLLLDCERSICAQISSATLETLTRFKPQFLQKLDRIQRITLVKEDYPIYDYRSVGAYVPAQLTDGTLVEFFEVLDAVRAFETEVGFRIEFPNNRHLKSSVFPLLQILKDNKVSLQLAAQRIELLVISSVYNQFHPDLKVLMLKIDDLRMSFSDLWSFLNLFFKAQDLFGNVTFDFQKSDLQSQVAMSLLLDHSEFFAPLFSQLQGRRILLLPWDSLRAYGDLQSFNQDLTVSSSYGLDYLKEVFRDQVRIVELSAFIGLRIDHVESIVFLEGHEECLNKIDSLKSKIKSKVSRIRWISVASGDYIPSEDSSFVDGRLYLNCNQSTEMLATIIDAIN